MNILGRLPKDLARIVNCLTYNRDSLKEVFRDIDTIRSDILDDVINAEMNIGLDELDEDQINSMWFPSVSEILYKLNNKQLNYCQLIQYLFFLLIYISILI